AFGIGAGLSVVSPWEGEGISATTASWSAGLFLVVVAMIAATFGGYITGRLRHSWEEVNIHERFFRDTAHGFVAWAFATVLTATLLAGAGTPLLPAARAGRAAGSGQPRGCQSRQREPEPRKQPIVLATSMLTDCCVSGRRLMVGPPVLPAIRRPRGPNFSGLSDLPR